MKKKLVTFEDRLSAFNCLAFKIDTTLSDVPNAKEAFERAAEKTGFGKRASWRRGEREETEEDIED